MPMTIAELVQWARSSPKSVEFSDLVRIIKAMGYTLNRTKGSHQIWTCKRKPMINLQPAGKMAKPYQVAQVLGVLDTHGIEVK
jgi:hypothetical protein